MATTLIVTRSRSPMFEPTGEPIELGEWLRFVANDARLRLRSQPATATNPKTGEAVSIPAMPGQTELEVGRNDDGKWVPFLGHRRGELVMRFSDDMNRPGDPAREKVAEVARALGARIVTDAAEEFFDW